MNEVSEKYVNYVFENKENDAAFRAAMKNATKDSLEWKAWPYIERFIGDINNKDKRHIYALVGEAIAKSRKSSNGTLSFGKAMRAVQNDGGESGDTSYSPRMARVLSFDDLDDLLDTFKQILAFLDSRDIALDYVAVLDDLLQARFEDSHERLKARWASEYLRKEE